MELKQYTFFELIERHGLLIVPYGIETLYGKTLFLSQVLLIVPYGIETCFLTKCNATGSGTFNRTLWN